jgi:hypothetical protein
MGTDVITPRECERLMESMDHRIGRTESDLEAFRITISAKTDAILSGVNGMAERVVGLRATVETIQKTLAAPPATPPEAAAGKLNPVFVEIAKKVLPWIVFALLGASGGQLLLPSDQEEVAAVASQAARDALIDVLRNGPNPAAPAAPGDAPAGPRP